MYIVRCPFCGFKQKSMAKKIVMCFKCNRRYKVFPERSRSRIVGVVHD